MTVLEKKVDALMRLATADNDFDIANIRTELRLLRCETSPESIYSEKERDVRAFLLSLNASEHMAGYPYLVKAILLGIKKEEATANMTWGIYAPIAVEYSSTIDKVSGAITKMIEEIWDNSPYDLLEKYFAGICGPEKDRPSPKRFIARAANVLKFELTKGADRKCL